MDEIAIAWRHYKNGFLPESGGTMDQPAKLLESVLLLDREVSRIEAEHARKASS